MLVETMPSSASNSGRSTDILGVRFDDPKFLANPGRCRGIDQAAERTYAVFI